MLKLNKEGTKTMTKRTGWEHHELGLEMREANLADLMTLYKREDEKYLELCNEFVRNLTKFTEEGKKEFEAQCELQREAATKVAVAIADMLTKTSK